MILSNSDTGNQRKSGSGISFALHPCSMVSQLIIVLKFLCREVTLKSAGQLFAFKLFWRVLTSWRYKAWLNISSTTLSPHFWTWCRSWSHHTGYTGGASWCSCLQVIYFSKSNSKQHYIAAFWHMKCHSSWDYDKILPSSSLITMAIILNPVCSETISILIPTGKGSFKLRCQCHRLKLIKVGDHPVWENRSYLHSFHTTQRNSQTSRSWVKGGLSTLEMVEG